MTKVGPQVNAIRKTVLVVDDDPDVRDTLAEVLRDEGYEVLDAGNGVEALDTLHHGARPDLILLDLMMPVMDGIEFRHRQLEERSLARIPVLVLTANRSGCRALGDVPCLEKPFDIDPLLDAVATLSDGTAPPAPAG